MTKKRRRASKRSESSKIIIWAINQADLIPTSENWSPAQNTDLITRLHTYTPSSCTCSSGSCPFTNSSSTPNSTIRWRRGGCLSQARLKVRSRVARRTSREWQWRRFLRKKTMFLFTMSNDIQELTKLRLVKSFMRFTRCSPSRLSSCTISSYTTLGFRHSTALLLSRLWLESPGSHTSLARISTADQRRRKRSSSWLTRAIIVETNQTTVVKSGMLMDFDCLRAIISKQDDSPSTILRTCSPLSSPSFSFSRKDLRLRRLISLKICALFSSSCKIRPKIVIVS